MISIAHAKSYIISILILACKSYIINILILACKSYILSPTYEVLHTESYILSLIYHSLYKGLKSKVCLGEIHIYKDPRLEFDSMFMTRWLLAGQLLVSKGRS